MIKVIIFVIVIIINIIVVVTIIIMIITYGKWWKRGEEEVKKHEVHLVDHHLARETTVQLEPGQKISFLQQCKI